MGGTMKRTAAAIVLLAGLGGCVSPSGNTAQDGARPFGQATRMQEITNVKGPTNEPIHVTAAGQMPSGKEGAGVVRADVRNGSFKNVISPTAGFASVNSGGGGGMSSGAGCGPAGCAPGAGGGLPAYGPTTSGFQNMMGRGGIVPVPAMGPYGAVAFPAGAGGPGSGMYQGMFAGGRTSIRFGNPAGMKITWQSAGGSFPESGLEAPARYNFPQMNMYRLRLSSIPNQPGKQYYPTLEVYPATAKTVTYLSHNTVPVTFTDEDFDQVKAGNLVVKVVYLPDEKFQDLAAVAGAEEVVSTRLEPGVNPLEEANRRGTILAVVRIGNVDLQDPNTPALDAPVGGGMAMQSAPPRMMAPTAPPMTMPNPMPPITRPTSGPTTATPAPLPSGVKSPTLSRPISLPSLN